MALAVCPHNVRLDAMQDQDDRSPLGASAEQGQKLVDAAVNATRRYVEEMIDGQHRAF